MVNGWFSRGRGDGRGGRPAGASPSPAQRSYLERGLDQPGGKLPLFDRDGAPVHPATVRACIDRGWAERWFANPTKPDWLVCRLTADGYRVVGAAAPEARTNGNSDSP